MDTHEALVGALNLIDTKGWWQLPQPAGPDRYCIGLAALDASRPEFGPHTPGDWTVFEEALEAIAEVIGCEPEIGAVGDWNDAPERTLEEVYGVLVAAIGKTAPAPDPTLVYADA